MITLITGVPGAGKTLYCVSEVLQPVCSTDRAVYVDGIPDLSLRHEPAPDPLDWPNWAPHGALIVIDEVQRIWRPAPAGQSPHTSIAELETHRHKGLDFVIMTQHPNLLHTNVRRLVGRHIHVRRTAMGVYVYEWPECVNPDTAWKNAHVKLRWSHPKKAFGLYKSASIHQQVKHRLPKAVWFFAASVAAVVALGGYTIKSIYSSIHPKQSISAPSSSSSQAAVEPQQVAVKPQSLFSMPYGASKIYLSGITGTRNGLFFHGAIVFELLMSGKTYYCNDEDLAALGYRITSSSDDVVQLRDLQGRILVVTSAPRLYEAPVDSGDSRGAVGDAAQPRANSDTAKPVVTASL